MPANTAAAPQGNYVATDLDRHLVSMHNADATLFAPSLDHGARVTISSRTHVMSLLTTTKTSSFQMLATSALRCLTKVVCLCGSSNLQVASKVSCAGPRHHIQMASVGVLAVIKSHNGFLTKVAHHAIKLYKINVSFWMNYM